MQVQWRNYSAEELARIAPDEIQVGKALVERTCPHCGNGSLRTYYQYSRHRTVPALVVQIWCSNCHRFGGDIGPVPEGIDFDDPLSDLSEDRQRELMSVEELFPELDLQWAAGRLPQVIRAAPTSL